MKMGLITVGLTLSLMACSAPDEAKVIELKCGAYKAVITCGHLDKAGKTGARTCNKNTLSFVNVSGLAKTIPALPLTQVFHDDKRPVVLEDTSPQGLSCYSLGDQTHRVWVEYSRGQASFTNEIFFDWFDSSGERLTQLGEPLKKDFQDPSEKSGQQLPRVWYIGEN